MDYGFGHVVVIGASAGGVHALVGVAAALPRLFPAPICIVQHVGNHPSVLPELLRLRGANDAVHAENGQRLASGTLHVAPPDRHMLLDGDLIRLSGGPKENHARPAIDPLFRTAAFAFGPMVIGVILTGQMDDGTAGLKAVKDCGGVAIVQDPASAAEPSMPRSALGNVDVDHCVALADIPDLLTRLVSSAARPRRKHAPEQVIREVAINQGTRTMEQLVPIGKPSPLTCPECHGGLWEMNDPKPLRFRCHTGHAFTALSLAEAQKDAAEESLWSSLRALREREVLLRRLADIAEATGDGEQARAGRAEADRLQEQARALQDIAEASVLAGKGGSTG